MRDTYQKSITNNRYIGYNASPQTLIPKPPTLLHQVSSNLGFHESYVSPDQVLCPSTFCTNPSRHATPLQELIVCSGTHLKRHVKPQPPSTQQSTFKSKYLRSGMPALSHISNSRRCSWRHNRKRISVLHPLLLPTSTIRRFRCLIALVARLLVSPLLWHACACLVSLDQTEYVVGVHNPTRTRSSPCMLTTYRVSQCDKCCYFLKCSWHLCSHDLHVRVHCHTKKTS